MNLHDEPKTVVIGGDLHYPNVNFKIFHAFVTFISKLKPDMLVLNGDISDFYSICSFDKNPTKANQIKEELDGLQIDIFTPLRKAMGKGIISATEGNHEDRLRRYMWNNASALATLPTMTIQALYQVEKFNIFYHQEDMIKLGSLMVTHGHIIRSQSGLTAKAHFERHGTSIVVGHCHRLGAYYKTDIHGTHGAWEGGCLCNFQQDFDKYPNWQHGWLVVKVWANGLFNVETVTIVNDECYVYGGKVVKI